MNRGLQRLDHPPSRDRAGGQSSVIGRWVGDLCSLVGSQHVDANNVQLTDRTVTAILSVKVHSDGDVDETV